MRRHCAAVLVVVVLSMGGMLGAWPVSAFAQNVFINEIHYDNTGTDAGEAIEVAGPAGTNLTGWSLVLYNGTGGAVYNTLALTGTIPDQQNGFGTLSFTYPVNGIQNGSPDGIALVNGSTVVQFLSYEGTFTAVGGPANGLLSTDIGVQEAGTEPVGQSLQLTGTGTTYGNFTWAVPTTATFGQINTGQTFAAGVGSLSLSVTPNTFSENAGAGAASATITRTGALSNSLNVTVTSSDTTETAVSPVVVIPASEASVDFPVDAINDAMTDGSQTVTLTAAASGFTSGTASVTVTDDDNTSGPLRIHDIQGAAHRSPLTGQAVVNVPGIVTVRRGNGFYLQDPTPDNEDATSEALFVFTSSAPNVTVGDSVLVSGTVTEFRPGGSGGTDNLTLTELSSPTVSVLSSGNALPAATVVGNGGRVPPSTVIDDDATGDVETSGTFDPATDGVDFYESLECMLVQVNDALAVGPTNGFGEIPVVSDGGVNASLLTTRGGIVVRQGDFNPERIFLDDTFVANPPLVAVGDRFSAPIVGVLDYSFGNFKLFNTTALPSVVPSGLIQETTTLVGTATQVTVATFNVENLDPKLEDITKVADRSSANVDDDVGEGKFAALAGLVVQNLHSPDIIALEEVQDNSGAEINDGEVDATNTYNMLIAAIQDAGGPVYDFRDVPPVEGQDGGQPGGNIRVGFLFNPARVTFVDRPGATSTTANAIIPSASGPQLLYSPGRIDPTNTAFTNSRKPLAGEFLFNGRRLFVIANHFNSKGGDDPLFGHIQPPVLVTEAQRVQQAQIVHDFVNTLVTAAPLANAIVLGDLNDFPFSLPLHTVAGNILTNLTEDVPENERYTFIFEGNSQVLDNLLVSDGLLTTQPEIDIVHVNAEFIDSASDHDPTVARFSFPCADDVSNKIAIIKTKPYVFGRPGRYRQLVTLINRTRNAISGPVSLVLDNLNENVVLVNKTGDTQCVPADSPYINLNIGLDNRLRPLETRFLLLEFNNPTGVSINYTTRVLAGSELR